MHFERAFKLSSLVLATTAFSGLLLARSIPPWLALITGILLILALLQTLGFSAGRQMFRQAALSPRLWNTLLVGALMVFLVDVTVISGELLPAGIHFLVMLLGIKLISADHPRDFRHLYAISLMAILASAALTTDVWYIPIFLLYLLATVWTLLLYHLTIHAADGNSSGGHAPMTSCAITGRFFWLTNGMAVITFALTLTIFFLLPRVGAGMLQKSRGETLKTTGFTERVDLGMIGSVKQNPQVVMRVELPDLSSGGSGRFYLRGLAYDRYNGRSWSISNPRRRNLGSAGEGTYVMRTQRNPSAGSTSPLIQQDILLEALDTSVLFAIPFAEYVSGDFGTVQADSMSALYLPFPTASRMRYSVTSRLNEITASEKTAAALDYPRTIQEHYLQLPELSEKVAQLSQLVTRQAVTPYDQITSIHRHLLRNYQYSLDVETTTSLHPLEDFLFTRKTGYCEHYATAMVIMLRAAGIPARLVTGFLATEWNEFGGYFTIRQRDAHAWVEVYFPQSGWISFDPTPPTDLLPARSGWEVVSRVGESLALYWDRFFVRYSTQDQLVIVNEIRDSSEALRGRLIQWSDRAKDSVAHFLSFSQQLMLSAAEGISAVTGLWVSAILLGLAVLARRTMWLMISRQKAQRRQVHITRLYQSMLRAAARQGLVKSPSTTPTEFARLVAGKWTAGAAIVAGLTELYCRGRFSAVALTTEELARAEHEIRSLEQLSRIAS
ncbi:MAG TPA: DUF3488 and transglutaminase-like domain-containing protein [Nitrospira sp.]